MSWAKDFHFTVDPPPKPVVVSPWAIGGIAAKVDIEYQTDDNLRKLYGIELGKGVNPFEAAKTVLGENDRAVWASFNWLSDPVVIASKDVYLKTLENSSPPLDREQLAAKVLALAEGEKINKNGVSLATIEAKDRIAAFKLYSEILGYTGKVEIDNSTKTFNTNNELKIVLVKAEVPKSAIVNVPNVKSEILNENVPSPISLKLVKAG